MILFGTMDSPMPEELENFTEYADSLSISSKVLIIAGGVIFVVAFFGCWGAVSDSSCMLFLVSIKSARYHLPEFCCKRADE